MIVVDNDHNLLFAFEISLPISSTLGDHPLAVPLHSIFSEKNAPKEKPYITMQWVHSNICGITEYLQLGWAQNNVPCWDSQSVLPVSS